MCLRIQRPLESLYHHLKNERSSIKDLRNFVRPNTRNSQAAVVDYIKTVRNKLEPIYDENQVQLQKTWTLQMMLKDLNDLNAIRANVFEKEEQQSNAMHVIYSVIERFDSVLRSKGIRIRTKLDSVNKPIEFDSHRFMQVFTTLFENALK